MREIKFRGKHYKTKEWLYGCLRYGFTMSSGYQIISTHITSNKREGSDEWFEEFEIDIETVGQYTGLKDKNGKEIYEGDIVKFRQHPHKSQTGEVKYSIKGARFFISYFDNDFERKRNCPRSEYFGTLNSIEVIGNIYENPELLK